MKLNLEDCNIEYTRGSGPGGQNKNKVHSCVVITHIPTGIRVRIDGRDQHKNKMVAIKELERRIEEQENQKKAVDKKARRDYNIHNTKTIRTYDFKSGLVKNHLNGKRASIKDVLEKGRIDLIQ